MPSTVGAVSTALKTALGTITGLRTASIQPDQLNPPIAFPVLNSVSYHQSMGTTSALTLMEYTIFVIVGRYTDRTAHETLDSFLSPTGALSVRTALENDSTLGGVVSTLIVDQSTNISSITSAEAEFLQISFNVRVHN